MQMEVYAGYSENAHNVGRVIDSIDELGELDSYPGVTTAPVREGTVTGSFNELTMQNGIPLTDEMQLQLAQRYAGRGVGEQHMGRHYSAAWAWAGNTPLRGSKRRTSAGTRTSARRPLARHGLSTGGARLHILPARHRRRSDDP